MRKTLSKKIYLTVALLFCVLLLEAQQQSLFFNQDFYQNFEKYLYSNKSDYHTSLKPYKASEVYSEIFPDTLYDFRRLKTSERFFRRAFNIVFHEHLIEFDETGYVRKSIRDSIQPNITIRRNYTDTTYVKRKFHIKVMPFVRFELGYDKESIGRTISYNKRGVALSADIGNKISLFTSFSENQAKFPGYLDPEIKFLRVIPGEGKARNFGTNSYDFSNVWAYINYTPNQYFGIEVGNGKHFIGDGYRSLFLSDNSFVYPYLKANISVWKLKYQIIFAELQNDIRENNDFALGVTRKIANFNYLSVAPTKWMQIGLYEGILWRRTGLEGNTEFNWNYINPIIGIRGLQKNLDVNKVYGLNYQFKLPLYMAVYGQWMINKFPTDGLSHINNRMGVQIGYKYFDVGGVENLNLQLEYNRVRPYAYTSEDSVLHYTHYEQPIAHPLGANFNEFILKFSYRYNRFYTKLSATFSNGGIDIIFVDTSNQNLNYRYEFQNGSNLFVNPSNAQQTNNLNVGSQADNYSNYKLLHLDLRIGVIINPKINLKAELGITRRRTWSETVGLFNGTDLSTSTQSTRSIFVFSVSTQLFNNYYDTAPRLVFLESP